MKEIKILYISTAKSKEDKTEWSGTVYHSLHALEEVGYKVDYVNAIGEAEQDIVDKLLIRYWCWIANHANKNVRIDESFCTTHMMRKVLGKTDYSKYDIIFVPTDMCIVSALPAIVTQKIVHLVDAPVQSLFDYYTEFSNLTWQNRLEASILTKRAFNRADLIIASSDWCKAESIKYCLINPDKIAVVEFGANINDDDIPEIKHEYNADKPLRIYWSGVNWVRKGGDVAFTCCKELIRRGHQIEFHITGMRELPEEIANQPWVYNHGFLNKNNPDEYHRLIDIMSRQDIFLFPSRAECSSIALCEANAFGLPCFVYDTGGTGNYVKNGHNGYMLPLSATGNDFADRIIESFEKAELHVLSLNARQKYKTSLNWKTWGENVKSIIECIISD